jgi:hypothetical protein
MPEWQTHFGLWLAVHPIPMLNSIELLLQRTNSILLRVLLLGLFIGVAGFLIAFSLFAFVIMSVMRLFGFRPRAATLPQFPRFPRL